MITKAWTDGVSQVFRAPAPVVPGPPIVLEPVASIDLNDHGGLATAADVSADGTLVAVRTYLELLMFPRPAGTPLESAFEAEPCIAPTELEAQGEAVAFLGSTGYVTVSEAVRSPLHPFAVPD